MRITHKNLRKPAARAAGADKAIRRLKSSPPKQPAFTKGKFNIFTTRGGKVEHYGKENRQHPQEGRLPYAR